MVSYPCAHSMNLTCSSYISPPFWIRFPNLLYSRFCKRSTRISVGVSRKTTRSKRGMNTSPQPHSEPDITDLLCLIKSADINSTRCSNVRDSTNGGSVGIQKYLSVSSQLYPYSRSRACPKVDTPAPDAPVTCMILYFTSTPDCHLPLPKLFYHRQIDVSIPRLLPLLNNSITSSCYTFDE